VSGISPFYEGQQPVGRLRVLFDMREVVQNALHGPVLLLPIPAPDDPFQIALCQRRDAGVLQFLPRLFRERRGKGDAIDVAPGGLADELAELPAQVVGGDRQVFHFHGHFQIQPVVAVHVPEPALA